MTESRHSIHKSEENDEANVEVGPSRTSRDLGDDDFRAGPNSQSPVVSDEFRGAKPDKRSKH